MELFIGFHGLVFLTRPNMEINIKMHWLELFTMIHVVRKQFSDRIPLFCRQNTVSHKKSDMGIPI